MNAPAIQPVAAPRRVAGAALVAFAAILPVRSGEQLLYAVSFGSAFLAFWLCGRALGRGLLGVPRLRFFTSVCLGQFAALAAGSVATAAAAASAHFFGASPRLALLMPAATLLLLSHELRARRAAPAPQGRLDLLTPFGIACIAVVLAIYSRHISALGLDTHEHTAWVEQILRLGYVPIAEPGTRIIGDYPRTFHLLTALWTAAGLSPPSGPFVKMMPFLQNALPMLAVAEMLEEAAARRGGEVVRTVSQAVLALGFFVYSFLLVPLVYPWGDLSGTPRHSSAAFLFAPAVLLLVGTIYRAPHAAAAALAVAPLLGVWALTMNPVVPVMLLAATVPVTAALWIFFGPPLAGFDRRRAGATAGMCFALALLVAAQDPWVVSRVASHAAPIASFLRTQGLVTFDEAVRQGLATAREKSFREMPATPPCSDRACVERLTVSALQRAVGLPARAATAAVEDARALSAHVSLPVLKRAFERALPLPAPAISDYAALPMFMLVAAGALLALARAIRRRRDENAPFPAERFLAFALAGCIASGICLAFAGGLASAFDDQTHERRILDVYVNQSHFVSPMLLWMPFAAACLVLAGPRAAIGWRTRPGLVASALLFWVALPLSARLNLNVPMRNDGFWSPVHLSDVRALRNVERAVPPGDAVLVPAEHWNVGNWENWVIPVGPTTAVLPYGGRRYLFDVYLGATYPLSWRDLEDRMCSTDPAVRRAFLTKQRARWLLVRDADAQAALKQKMCGAPLSALGVQLPPTRSEGGIHLFRLAGVP